MFSWYYNILGVPVIGFNSEYFPAFFTNDSGIKSPLTITTPKEIALMMVAQSALQLRNGKKTIFL